jgi:diadenosine tetraphosphate (Ap4A) HIT family hydrolase
MAKTQDLYSEEVQKSARVSDWYERVKSSLDKCPFCDLKGKYIVAEKDNVVLTVNIFPYIDGHLLIIPRRHLKKFDEINLTEWRAMRYLIKLGIKILEEELGIENTNTLYREGVKAGVSLEHLHMHILPITPEFMQYKKTHFIWKFQEIKFAPVEMAKRLRKACEKHGKK